MAASRITISRGAAERSSADTVAKNRSGEATRGQAKQRSESPGKTQSAKYDTARERRTPFDFFANHVQTISKPGQMSVRRHVTESERPKLGRYCVERMPSALIGIQCRSRLSQDSRGLDARSFKCMRQLCSGAAESDIVNRKSSSVSWCEPLFLRIRFAGDRRNYLSYRVFLNAGGCLTCMKMQCHPDYRKDRDKCDQRCHYGQGSCKPRHLGKARPH